jgi:hypothetical protein
VSAIEDLVWAQDNSKPRAKYCIWVDTLCCPVAKLEPEYNRLSLLRMKTVYEQATHVLVLDKALSVHDAEKLHPATALLRIFGSSIWMRRLWTLQGWFGFNLSSSGKGLTHLNRGSLSQVYILPISRQAHPCPIHPPPAPSPQRLPILGNVARPQHGGTIPKPPPPAFLLPSLTDPAPPPNPHLPLPLPCP